MMRVMVAMMVIMEMMVATIIKKIFVYTTSQNAPDAARVSWRYAPRAPLHEVAHEVAVGNRNYR